MNLKLVSLFVLVASSVSWGQEVYFFNNESSPSGNVAHIAKINVGETTPTDVVTQAALDAAFSILIPDAIDGGDFFNAEFELDSVDRKLYFPVGHSILTKNGVEGRKAIMRSDLDGTNIELVYAPANDTETLSSPQVHHSSTVPAVSNVGLGVLVTLLLGGGGLIIAKRTRIVVSP